MNFYIADLHFGHSAVIYHSRRPFGSIEEMDKTLINNWNVAVREDDNVYILGDFCYKSGKPASEYLKQLKGNKYLILGNHDSAKSASIIYDGVIWARPYAEIKDGGQKIVLSHYPMAEWNGFFHGSIHLYGHIHNNTANNAYRVMKNIEGAYNVGADILGFTPRILEEVIEANKVFQKNHPCAKNI